MKACVKDVAGRGIFCKCYEVWSGGINEKKYINVVWLC